MAQLGIDKNGDEIIFERADDRAQCPGNCPVKFNMIKLRKGDIQKLTGKKLKKGDEPIKYTE